MRRRFVIYCVWHRGEAKKNFGWALSNLKPSNWLNYVCNKFFSLFDSAVIPRKIFFTLRFDKISPNFPRFSNLRKKKSRSQIQMNFSFSTFSIIKYSYQVSMFFWKIFFVFHNFFFDFTFNRYFNQSYILLLLRN